MESMDDFRKRLFEMIKKDYDESWDEDLIPYKSVKSYK